METRLGLEQWLTEGMRQVHSKSKSLIWFTNVEEFVSELTYIEELIFKLTQNSETICLLFHPLVLNSTSQEAQKNNKGHIGSWKISVQFLAFFLPQKAD